LEGQLCTNIADRAAGRRDHEAAGASSARIGPCYSGPDTGQIATAVTYPDWASFGAAHQQSQAADSELQRVFTEFTKIVELKDRSIIVADEL